MLVYCAAFDCNANSSKNKVTCSWSKFPPEPTLFKKANVKPTKHSRLCSHRGNLFRLQSGPEKVVAPGDPGAKITLKDDDVPTLFPVVEAVLMPPIRRTSTTTIDGSLGELPARIQVMSAHGEFGQHFVESSARSSGNFGLIAQRA